MATPTYDPIASTTLTSSASSVTFSSLDTIAAGYRDLVLVAEGLASANTYLALRVNGDTASNYYQVNMRGNGSLAYSRADNFPAVVLGVGNVVWGSVYRCMNIIQLFDFSQTDKHKSILGRTDAANSGTCAEAARWANTSAITSVQVYPYSGGITLEAGTVVSLYGIAA